MGPSMRAGLLAACVAMLLIPNLAYAQGDDQALPAGDGAGQDIRVQIVAETSATIGAPMAGRLDAFPLKDGDSFKRGQSLAKFVCAEQQGALAHAKAVVVGKRDIFENKQQLRNLGTGSELDFEVADAELQESEADTSVAQAMLDDCSVIAPFDGRVSAVFAHNYQYVAIGAPLLDILDDRDIELEMIVPSRWLAWLRPGTGFSVTIDETGQTYHARLTRVSAKVDSVSRTIKVYGRMDGATSSLLPGMSGQALLKPPVGSATMPK